MKKFLLFLLCVFLLMLLMSPVYASSKKDDIRLGIMSFTSKVPDVKDDMAAAVSDFFLRTLSNSGGGIRLVERERFEYIASEVKAGKSGLIDSGTAAEAGRIAGCNYMLIGALTGLSKNSTEKKFTSVYSKTKMRVTAMLDVRVVKVETGDIVFADSASATVQKEDEAYDAFNFKKTAESFDGIETTAIAKAVTNLTPKIVKALAGDANPNTNTNTQQTAQQVNASSVVLPASGTKAKTNAKYENSSTDPAKVVNSYGLKSAEAKRLIARHKDALNMKSNSAKVQEYAKMFEAYSTDYLAAYYAALAEFNMNHGSASVGWCNKALGVNPRYYPANELKKKAEGLVKQ